MIGYLLSFFYFENEDLDALLPAGSDEKFFADSGAYSAHTLGSPINLADYAAWLRRWEHCLDPYANLDVTFDHRQGQVNQRELEKLGLAPIPVWHIGDPLANFREIAEGYEYAAIGNLVSRTKRDPKLWGLLDQVHEIAAANDCGLHAFGLSSWPMINRWPWRSVDSSSAGAGFRYGRVQLFDFYSKRWLGFHSADAAAWHQNGWLIREYGFDPAEFSGRSRKELYDPLVRLAGATWAKIDEAIPETNFYIVATARDQGVYREGVEIGRAAFSNSRV